MEKKEPICNSVKEYAIFIVKSWVESRNDCWVKEWLGISKIHLKKVILTDVLLTSSCSADTLAVASQDTRSCRPLSSPVQILTTSPCWRQYPWTGRAKPRPEINHYSKLTNTFWHQSFSGFASLSDPSFYVELGWVGDSCFCPIPGTRPDPR